jgi:tetratricopeptide (TPR) repeat protein
MDQMSRRAPQEVKKQESSAAPGVSSPGSPDRRTVFGICLFLVTIIFVVFGRAAGFGFINYDDQENVYENPVVEKGLSAQAVGWALTHPLNGNWIPLTTLSHMVDCQIFGLRTGGHHLVNVLWHAANAILLFLVLRKMTASLWRSALVAAVFAIHPLRAESVAWVSERKDVLSGFFFLLTIWAYARNLRRPSRAGRILVVLWFALGLLAKSMVATLPFVLLVLDYWPLRRWQSPRQFVGLVGEKIPLFALSAASCVATALVPGLLVTGDQRMPILERIGNALVSYVVYLRQMLFPVGLAIPYPNVTNGQPLGRVCLALLVLVAMTAGVIACWKKRPYLLAGWLWYLGMLAPVIGIIEISKDTAHADRYTYLPGIGLALAGTWAVGDWSAGWKHRRAILGSLTVPVLGALAVWGRIQTAYWKDSQTLWTRALACTSSNSVAHFNLGTDFVQKRELDEGIRQFQMALEIRPDYVEARNNLGVALGLNGDLDSAIFEYRKVLETHPDSVEALDNLGSALFEKGDPEEAIVQYRALLAIRPDHAQAHYNLAIALTRQGNLEEAISQYRIVLELDPAAAEARYNLAATLFQKGDLDEAIAQYRKVLEIKPDNMNAHYNLALALARTGNPVEAAAQYQKALEIQPDYEKALNNLAWLLATTPDAPLRNGTKAVALAEHAVQLSAGRNPLFLHTLAAAYAEAGRYADAVTTARRALGLAVEQKNDALAATLQQEIKLYESDMPVRSATR